MIVALIFAGVCVLMFFLCAWKETSVFTEEELKQAQNMALTDWERIELLKKIKRIK